MVATIAGPGAWLPTMARPAQGLACQATKERQPCPGARWRFMRAKANAEDNQKCLSYGAQPGTPAYVSCRAQLDSARTQASATICRCSTAGGACSRCSDLSNPPAGDDTRRALHVAGMS
jgi:hypothetical protein